MAQQADHSMPYAEYQQVRFSILADEYRKLINARALHPQALTWLYHRLEVGDLGFELPQELDKRREELLATLKEVIDKQMGPGFTTGFLSVGSQVPDDPSDAFEPPPDETAKS